MDNLQVFISWSGPRAESIAREFKNWIERVVQRADAWFSARGDAMGTMWAAEIRDRLRHSKLGVVILTAENRNSPWVHFEAGAIAAAFEEKRCIPVLCGITVKDMSDPLRQLHGADITDREQMSQLVRRLLEASGQSFDDAKLEAWFAPHWDAFSTNVNELIKRPFDGGPTDKPKSTQEMLDEILDVARRNLNATTDASRVMKAWKTDSDRIMSQAESVARSLRSRGFR